MQGLRNRTATDLADDVERVVQSLNEQENKQAIPPPSPPPDLGMGVRAGHLAVFVGLKAKFQMLMQVGSCLFSIFASRVACAGEGGGEADNNNQAFCKLSTPGEERGGGRPSSRCTSASCRVPSGWIWELTFQTRVTGRK